MLTIDDIRAIPLFSALPDNELEHLAHTSADLHLCAAMGATSARKQKAQSQ